MMLLHRLLNYYLDSDLFFRVYLEMFFDDMHLGTCGKERFVFKSQVYKNIEEKLNKEGGYHLALSLKKTLKYFTLLRDNYQLSAVIFAEWYGLNRRQLIQIADRHSPNLAWQKLNYFLCNSDKNVFPDDYDYESDLKKLDYYIEKEDVTVPARYYVKNISFAENKTFETAFLVDNENVCYIFGTDKFYDIRNIDFH